MCSWELFFHQNYNFFRNFIKQVKAVFKSISKLSLKIINLADFSISVLSATTCFFHNHQFIFSRWILKGIFEILREF